MKISMTAIIERKRASLYTQKAKKLPNILYTKSHTLFKKLDNFRYVFLIQKAIHLTLRDYHEIFEVGIYTKSMTLCVT